MRPSAVRSRMFRGVPRDPRTPAWAFGPFAPIASLVLMALLALLTFLLLPAWNAEASTIAQNVSWTIDRPGTDEKVRLVAYGDSIFAGYKGSISDVAIWSAPNVDGEYLQHDWQTDVEVIRRTKSGAKARDVYNNKIVDDASYMQDPSTRVVAFEMCGNDGLQARTDFRSRDGECDYAALDQALANCTTYVEKAMQFINENAAPGVVTKVVSNLYYPGYDADDVASDCTDGGTSPNLQDVFLEYLARMNWRICHLARENDFDCADSFAQFMGADYDSNDDRRIDSRALRYKNSETEQQYVTKITQTLRGTIRDANFKRTRPTRSFDYIQSDDVHPTFRGGDIDIGTFGGSGSGESPPRFRDDQYRRDHNPVWRRYGHERMGWAMSVYHPDEQP